MIPSKSFGARTISLRLSDADDARIRGAAAVTGLSVSAYLKWLVSNGKSGTQNDSEIILRRLDDLLTAIANISTAPREGRVAPLVGLPARSALVNQLRERGLPSSTIRQVEAVLDDLEGKSSAHGAAGVNTNVNRKPHVQQ
jgi:hypothetical protein